MNDEELATFELRLTEPEECKVPRGLLGTLARFAKKCPGKVSVRRFDIKTDKEIFGAKK